MKRKIWTVVTSIVATLTVICAASACAQESKRPAALSAKSGTAASDAAQVESKPAPLAVPADVLKSMTPLFDGKSPDCKLLERLTRKIVGNCASSGLCTWTN
jgi:hypothetical protein